MNLDTAAARVDQARTLLAQSTLRTVQQAGLTVAFWSKSPAYTTMPLLMELSGFAPGRVYRTEPKSRKGIFAYYTTQNKVSRSEQYDAKEKLLEVVGYEYTPERIISRKFDKRGTCESLTLTVLADEQPSWACRVDSDGEYWCYEYTCNDGRVQNLIAYASNSVPGTVINVEYDEEAVACLWFEGPSGRVDIFRRMQ
ncbi:hypothetical protein [Pseudomonas sp. KNUC1026]|uniref:hypothetical protein n=1 Tax=Pseudomonas sp. KNUC1026 TaxID=2893890 RepID=UPI001F253D0E|nr:hypothetical protein [Pseudomonas sp. KNUC1026]UFH49092.1 hypothetical protein LN139_19575 [Pseudomonas sp. KNUC1026]